MSPGVQEYVTWTETVQTHTDTHMHSFNNGEDTLSFGFSIEVYLLGMQCGFNDEPALCAVCVLHLQQVVSQVFPSHFHEALLALHTE